MTTEATNSSVPVTSLAPRSLYAISVELMEIEHGLADMDADPETIAQAIDTYLEDSDELREKVDRYVMLIREFQSRAKARDQEAIRLTNLSEADMDAAKTLSTRLHEFMRSHEIAKLETLHFKLARQANGGVQAVKLEITPEYLPAKYQRVLTTIAADNAALREDLLAVEATHKRIDEIVDENGDVALGYEPEFTDLREFLANHPIPEGVSLADRGERLVVK